MINTSTTKKHLFVDSENVLWIATFGSGLLSFDPVETKFKQCNSNGNGKGTNGNIVLDVIQENDDNLLVAIDQGVIN